LKFKTQFDNKPSQTRPLGFSVKDDLQNLGFKKKNVLPTTVSTIPLWLLKRANCNFSLCYYDKTTTNSEVFKRKFFELRPEFSHHLEIYTDGSKDGIKTAAAVVAPSSVKTVRLPDNASIFTTEIHALDMALDIIRRTRSKDYVVFSDSLFSLQAIESCKVENPLILKILKNHNQLINSGKFIIFLLDSQSRGYPKKQRCWHRC